MLTQRTALVVAAIATLSAATYVAADVSKAELGAAFGSNDSHVRHETFKKIDGNNKKNLKVLYKILEGKAGRYANWHDREAAIDVLARVSNEDVLKDMKKKLEGSKGSYLMRQGVCKAFAKMGNDDVLLGPKHHGAVPELRRVLDLHRHLTQLLEDVFAHESRVPAGAAAADDEAPRALQSRQERLHWRAVLVQHLLDAAEVDVRAILTLHGVAGAVPPPRTCHGRRRRGFLQFDTAAHAIFER